MKKNFFFLCITLVCLLLNSFELESHPWGGLVIDNQGNLYFTFICPFADDDHYACVWKLDSGNNPQEVLKARRSPSDIILERTISREIYGAERYGNRPDYVNTLWKISGGEVSVRIKPSSDQQLFHIQTYAVTDDGEIFFARENMLFKRNSNDTVSKIDPGIDIDRIQLLEMGPSNSLYILADDNLYVRRNESTQLLATGLREKEPENIPFRGANIMFDMAVDDESNVFLAYYGNRKVIKVSTTGDVSDVLSAKAPWSPHGVDVYNGEVFVLESTFGNGAWWKFWNRSDTEIIPRIRKVSTSGDISEVFRFQPR